MKSIILCEGKTDAILYSYYLGVENVCSFIDGLTENEYIKSNYLFKRGLIPKSKLGTYFSIVSPGRTFDGYNKILESIPWEKYLEFQQTLKLLSEI